MTNKRTAVIGTVFMDVKGFAHSGYDPVGTNIGDVRFIHGGVGRNVAVNMANIGISVSFVSTVDVGGSGDDIIEKLHSSYIDTNYILRTEGKGIGLWLAVLDEKGNLAGSISQQPDYSLFDSHIDKVIENVVSDCGAVVLEMDMTKSIAEKVFFAAEKANVPVYVIVGNMSVILANRELLSKTECFICNNIEFGKLSGKSVSDISPDEIKRIAEELNLRSIVITKGADGAVYYDKSSGSYGHQPAIEADVADTTGAGDAFFSGTVGALICGYGIASACEFGSKLASMVIASSESSVGYCADFFK